MTSKQQKCTMRIKFFRLFLAVALPVAALVLLMTALGGLSVPAVHAAATETVTNTDDSGAGSLRQAIADVDSGGTIDFSVTGVITLTSGQLEITKTLTINGPGASNLAISGNDNSRVFLITNTATVTITGVTIRDGSVVDEGGGIFVYGSGTTLNLISSTVTDNQTTGGDGGGIENLDGTLNITGCTISNNQAAGGNPDGGGIENRGTLTIINSTISGNTAGNNGAGGGISHYGGDTATIISSAIFSNTSETYGGGIYNASQMTITNSTVIDNSSQRGGGIYSNVTLTVVDSTISGNDGTVHGGGFYLGGGSTTLTNSTVSGNTTDGAGGGFDHEGGTLNLFHVTVTGNTADDEFYMGGGIYTCDTVVNSKNTIIADNEAINEAYDDCYIDIIGACSGAFTSQGYNLVGSGTGCPSAGTGDQTTGDPRLGALANNGGSTQTHALLSGSPAIDQIASGVNGCGGDYTSDQRGVSRPQPAGDNCDIGAFELVRGIIIVEKQTDPNGAGGSFDFTDTITAPNSFSLVDDGLELFTKVMSGTYIITETNLATGFDLTDITCSDDDSIGTETTGVATVELEAGETVTCTFTNTQRGTIPPVGGIVVPVSKLGLVTPWMGLAALVAVGAVGLLLRARRRR